MKGKKIISLVLALVVGLSTCVTAFAEYDEKNQKMDTVEKINDTLYYHSINDDYLFEKVSHPDRGAGEIDGFLDENDSRSQSYAWSAIESGDYVYVGTCYNSTYGIYWRNVFNMMLGLGKTQAEAMKIARDFVQFVFDEKFDETLLPHGIIVKFHKQTGEFSLVYDSKLSNDSAIASTSCSGYRMAFEFHDKLYFVSLAHPTMFLLEIDPQDNGDTEKCSIAFQRSLSADGRAKRIASGVHGLVVYDDEILMCLADDKTDNYPEGGLILASSDARNWRVIATEDDLGPSAYHEYDGLMGGGIWDIIEYNNHVYVTVVTDLTDTSTGIVNKQGFSLYRGTKDSNGEFKWEMMAGDTSKEGVEIPYGFGTTYSMACNMWVYNGYLYLGTYNDPMLDFTAVADRGDFSDLYYDLFYSINLYRMDENENFELIAGRPNDIFTEVKGNMGPGFGDCANQYVWRMTTYNDQFWLGTYDASVLASAFTQLTDGQLLDMSEEEYLRRLSQLEQFATSLGVLQDKYKNVFNTVLGSQTIQKLFNSIQKLVDAGTKEDPVPAYKEVLEEYNNFKDKIMNSSKVPSILKPLYEKLLEELNNQFFKPTDKILNEIGSVVYYFGVNYYMKNATKGFDLLVSNDGVNFEIVTNNGFGDPNNHGVRTLTPANNDETLYVGTANPYYGGQIWKLVDKIPDSEIIPECPTDNEIEDLKIPVKVYCSTNMDHSILSTLVAKDVTVGDVVKDDENQYQVLLTVDGSSYIKSFKDKYDTSETTHTLTNNLTQTLTLKWSDNRWNLDDDTIVTYAMSEEELDSVESYVIHFDAGDHGTIENEDVIVKPNEAIGEAVPEVQVDDGYVFIGWLDNDGTTYSSQQVSQYIPNCNMTFVALYQEDIKEFVTVSFDAGTHGSFATNEVTKFEVEKGTGISSVPTVIANDGCEFKGWKLSSDGEVYSSQQIKEMTFDSNATFIAIYQSSIVIPDKDTVTITFESGEHGQLLGVSSYTITKGSNIATIPVIDVEEGYEFTGWVSNNQLYTHQEILSMSIVEDITFEAQYKEIKNISHENISSENNKTQKVDTGDQMFASFIGYACILALIMIIYFRIKNKKHS